MDSLPIAKALIPSDTNEVGATLLARSFVKDIGPCGPSRWRLSFDIDTRSNYETLLLCGPSKVFVLANLINNSQLSIVM